MSYGPCTYSLGVYTFALIENRSSLNPKVYVIVYLCGLRFYREQKPCIQTPMRHSRVMDIPPVNVHQRVPIVLGSKEDVEER